MFKCDSKYQKTKKIARYGKYCIKDIRKGAVGNEAEQVSGNRCEEWGFLFSVYADRATVGAVGRT